MIRLPFRKTPAIAPPAPERDYADNRDARPTNLLEVTPPPAAEPDARQRIVPSMQVISWRNKARRRVRRVAGQARPFRALYIEGDTAMLAAAIGRMFSPSRLARLFRALF